MNEETTLKVVEVVPVDCPKDGPWEITTFDVIAGFVVVFLFAYIVAGIKWSKDDETS